MGLQYLLIAENITYKNNKLSCINIIDNIMAIAMPSEISFDMVIICGPDWEVGEHNLNIKARFNTGTEFEIGTLKVEIPSQNFIYNALAPDLKMLLDASVTDVSFVISDNEKEILTRKYMVNALFVQNSQATPETANA